MTRKGWSGWRGISGQSQVEKGGQFKWILQSINALLDEEALRVVNLIPKWIPFYQDGEPMYMMYNLPINFKLN